MCDEHEKEGLPHQLDSPRQSGYALGSLLDTDETASCAEDDADMFGYSGGQRVLFIRSWHMGRRMRDTTRSGVV